MGKDEKKLLDFFYEAGQLKRVARSGWWTAGIKFPESVAEHCWRAAVIGYFLGKRAGLNAGRVALMCLFHDMPEARVNDAHKIQARYVDMKPAEAKALEEQAAVLPPGLGEEFRALVRECEDRAGAEGRLAKDADLLECALQGREYELDGFQATKDWVKRVGQQLSSREAKELFRELEKGSPTDWWRGLKKGVISR